MRLILLTLLGFLLNFNGLVASSGTSILKGKVIEKDSQLPVIFGTVALYKQGILITGTDTDIDGNYFLGNIQPDTYDIEFKYLGYMDLKRTGVLLKEGETMELNVEMAAGGIILDDIVVQTFCSRLVDVDNTTSGTTISTSKIATLGVKSINGIVATSAGLSKAKNAATIRGSRSNGIVYFIDGIRSFGGTPDHEGEKRAKSTESYETILENSFFNSKDEPLSTFSIDVDRAAYSNVRRFIQNSERPPADAVRIEEMINYFDYDYAQPKGKSPLEMHTTYTDCPWNENTKLLHIGLQAKGIEKEDLPSSNLVFLIDVSGSMHGANKLPLVQSSLKLLVKQLRPDDKISIVTYAGQAGVLLEPTSGSEKAKILDAIGGLQSGGSTAGAQGIITAYDLARKHFLKEGNNRVILSTDGDFNVGVSDNKSLEKLIEEQRESGVFLSVLGFGMDNYKDDKMQILADKGNGNHAYIDNIREAKKVLVKEFGSTVHTLAKDVKLQVEFNPHLVSSYKLIGYENRLLNKEDFNDDKKDAGEMGYNHTVTAIYEIVPTTGEITSNVDDLKYQDISRSKKFNDELATIKFRYKDPLKSKSKKVVKIVKHKGITLEDSSNNVRFSIAVAQFGQVLRHNADDQTFDRIIALATSSMGDDKDGLRQELINLVETTKLLFSEENELNE